MVTPVASQGRNTVEQPRTCGRPEFVPDLLLPPGPPPLNPDLARVLLRLIQDLAAEAPGILKDDPAA